MTILVCGGSGLVGKELCNFFESNNINYIATYNNNVIPKENCFKINFSDINEIENFISSKNIKLCIFLVVQRSPEICEDNWNEIKITNIDMVNNISFVCNKLNTKLIHLSTDYVFDGTNQPNFPNSKLNPLQNYGISKLISELKVINNCSDYLIIRVPVLYSSNCNFPTKNKL